MHGWFQTSLPLKNRFNVSTNIRSSRRCSNYARRPMYAVTLERSLFSPIVPRSTINEIYLFPLKLPVDLTCPLRVVTRNISYWSNCRTLSSCSALKLIRCPCLGVLEAHGEPKDLHEERKGAVSYWCMRNVGTFLLESRQPQEKIEGG